MCEEVRHGRHPEGRGSAALSTVLLEGEVGKDGREGLALGGPVGVKLNDPGDAAILLQLLLCPGIRAGDIRLHQVQFP